MLAYFCRYYVLYKLPQLTFLDSRAVSAAERKEAKRVGEFMRVVKPSEDMVRLLCVCVCECECMLCVYQSLYSSLDYPKPLASSECSDK